VDTNPKYNAIKGLISELLTSETFLCNYVTKTLLFQRKPKCPTFWFFAFLIIA